MKKNRVLASIVLTVGLGLSGVTSASASDAAPAQPWPSKGRQGCVVVWTQKDGKLQKVTYELKNGTYRVNTDKVAAAKCAPKPARLPGDGKGRGKGKVICVIHKQDGSHSPGQKVTEGTDGKVYVNGKQVPKTNARVICRHLPGHGKGDHVCVIIHKKDGQEPGKAGQTVTEGADGKIYVNGKQVSKDELPQKCPPKLPQRPGDGTGKDTGGTGKDTSVVGAAVGTVGATVGRALSVLG